MYNKCSFEILLMLPFMILQVLIHHCTDMLIALKNPFPIDFNYHF